MLRGAVLTALLERGQALGAARADRVRGEVARAVSIEVADVVVSVAGDAVVVAGRGVRLRALTEPALRWIGRML